MIAYSDDVNELKKKQKANAFNVMDLEKDLLSGLNRMGYKVPTPVQRKTLPIALAGMDAVCMARTGSGKTAAFLIPMLQKIGKHESAAGVRGVILSPTRELAVQTFRFAKDMAKFMDLRIVSIIGGDPLEPQFEALANRPDVIVATPGRLMHHLQEISTFKLNTVKHLVFDEADRLFEMGFAEQLNEIIKQCPEDRQTLLFSATMPRQLIQFTRAGLHDPQLIRLESDNRMSDELRMAFLTVRSNEKMAGLIYLVRKIIPATDMTIVFTATKHHSEYVHALFQKLGVTSTIVYGTMDQDARSSNLKAFRNGSISYLIVTDLAARGIDVPLLNNVINLHFPPSPKLFVHRCGRAARQGRIGYAFSLVEPEELGYMVDIHMFLGKEVKNKYEISEDAYAAGAGAGGATDAGDDVAGEKKIMAANGKGNVGGTMVVPVSKHSKGYTMMEMQPHHIHTGLFPQDVIDEENDFLKRKVQDDIGLAAYARIADNGLLQYRRTRMEASVKGVSTAKKLTKSNAIVSIHPLISGEDPERCSAEMVEKSNFVRVLQTFRPAQTVFESGIGTGTGSSAIKGKGKKGKDEDKGVQVMKAFRKSSENSLERNKEVQRQKYDIYVKEQERIREQLAEKDGNSSLVYVGTEEEAKTAKEEKMKAKKDAKKAKAESAKKGGTVWDELEKISEEEERDKMGIVGEAACDEYEKGDTEGQSVIAIANKKRKSESGALAASNTADKEKPRLSRLSIAERKRLKKQGLSQEDMKAHSERKAATAIAILEGAGEDIEGNAGVKSFIDNKYYMAYGTEDEKVSFAEEALQPQSGLKTAEAANAAILEGAMLDASGSGGNVMDILEANKKKRIMRWDPKKRKFVKQSLQEIADLKGNKRMRSETGVGSRGKSKKPVGELYKQWAKKTHREINTENVTAGLGVDDYRENADGKPLPRFKNNIAIANELKNEQEVKKIQSTRENMRVKNLPKEKRKAMENAARQKKTKHKRQEELKGTGHKKSNKRLKAIMT